METSLLEKDKYYIYKGKVIKYFSENYLVTPVRYIFKGPRGGEISLSQEQVFKYVKNIHENIDY
jgi:hypothetical protein